MAVHENDIDLLHDYLDGELPVPECEGLWRRLAVEPELVAELDTLRSEHSARQAVWSSYDPTDQAVTLTEKRILQAAKRHDVIAVTSRRMRFLTTAAACMLIGVSIGWMGRDKYTGNTMTAGNPSALQNASVAGNLGSSTSPGTFSVTMRDDTGHVVSFPFKTLDEARQFADDLEKTQNNRQEIGNATVVQAMNRF
jgi:anti-sigma factor RsiW